MKLVDPADLERNIYIQLRVLRGPTKTALQHVSTDLACKATARLIIERCLSGLAIYAPDAVHVRPDGMWNHGSSERGRFGITEPWPAPASEHVHSDRCRLCGANDIDALGEHLAKAMWDALVPETPFENAGDHRTNILLIAHRAINWLGRDHARQAHP